MSTAIRQPIINGLHCLLGCLLLLSILLFTLALLVVLASHHSDGCALFSVLCDPLFSPGRRFPVLLSYPLRTETPGLPRVALLKLSLYGPLPYSVPLHMSSVPYHPTTPPRPSIRSLLMDDTVASRTVVGAQTTSFELSSRQSTTPFGPEPASASFIPSHTPGISFSRLRPSSSPRPASRMTHRLTAGTHTLSSNSSARRVLASSGRERAAAVGVHTLFSTLYIYCYPLVSVLAVPLQEWIGRGWDRARMPPSRRAGCVLRSARPATVLRAARGSARPSLSLSRALCVLLIPDTTNCILSPID